MFGTRDYSKALVLVVCGVVGTGPVGAEVVCVTVGELFGSRSHPLRIGTGAMSRDHEHWGDQQGANNGERPEDSGLPGSRYPLRILAGHVCSPFDVYSLVRGFGTVTTTPQLHQADLCGLGGVLPKAR